MKGPTARQLAFLRFIAWQRALNGYPPTYADLRRFFGVGSNNGVADVLYAMRRKGYVDWTPYESRTLRVTLSGRAVLRADALGHTV